jgi:hypothetical protein
MHFDDFIDQGGVVKSWHAKELDNSMKLEDVKTSKD